MKFSPISVIVTTFVVGTLAKGHQHVARQNVVQVTVGTTITSTNPQPQALTIVLQDDASGSQPLSGSDRQISLSAADLPSPFNEVTCDFTTALGPPAGAEQTPTCDLNTKIGTASTQDGFSATINFDATNEPACMVCNLEQSQLKKRDL